MTVLAPVAVLLLLLVTSTNVVPVRQIVDQRAELDATRQRLDALVADNKALERHVLALETPVEIERIARDELGYVFPGETAYLVMRPDAPDVEPTPNGDAPGVGSPGVGSPGGDSPSGDLPGAPADATPTRSEPNGGGWRLGGVWDWLTGRDLAGG